MKADDLISMILMLGVLPMTILLIVFYIQKAKIKERSQLLDKGVDILSMPKKESAFNSPLMWGLFSIGIGLGFFLGFLLNELEVLLNEAFPAFLAMIFGGIGLTIYHYINKKEGKK